MEMNSPPPPPSTVTVRRNPHRKARATPSSHVPFPIPLSSTPPPSSVSKEIPPFPIQDILSVELPQNPKSEISASTSPLIAEKPITENLKVFLRIRPLAVHSSSGKNKNGDSKSRTKDTWPRNPAAKNASRDKAKKKSALCVTVNDSHSVTLCPPTAMQDVKRIKSEVYEGFSHVFSADSSQDEVFEKMVAPLVDEFLRGKSGMIAALGPSGSGKTHTIFGSPREPGMVPLALRSIFSRIDGHKSQKKRTFYLSMFEIYSERGKAERLLDLSQDGTDLCMQHSTVKGLKEVVISDVQQAESLIACGMFKRATAMTNSNSQSSRSQCIINIRAADKIDGEIDVQVNSAVLTIVDLAGAEREKRTGNQGARLLESNFINNTSMVFGLCLRSLLEHQKNPKKPLQKHFQSSLLTRYLRDYLEGRRRMALILTVRPGQEDYVDTSFLLKQATPFMKIRFGNVDEPFNSLCMKRQIPTLPRKDQPKRMKFSSPDPRLNNGRKETGDKYQHQKEVCLPRKDTEIGPESCSVHCAKSSRLEVDNSTFIEDGITSLAKEERNNKIMQNFAKALWNVLKQYKEKLEVAENQIQCLQESLTYEMARRSEIEIQLKDLKAQNSCQREAFISNQSSKNRSVEEGCQPADVCELNAGVSLNQDELENIDSEQRFDTTVNNFGDSSALCSVELSKEQGCQECEGFSRNVDNAAESTKLKEIIKDDPHYNADATGVMPSNSVMSSPKLLTTTTRYNCQSVERDHLTNEEDKIKLHQPIKEKDVELVPRMETKLKSPLKPRRKLLPVSSMLLKDVNCLDFDNENEKPKGTRGEKKFARDDISRTQGSISLVRLLRNNLHL